jgi:hypothetical protein
MNHHFYIKLRFSFFLPVFISAVLGIGWSSERKFETQENPYPVPKIEMDLKIDGSLDEAAWNRAAVIELNYEVRPRENVTPPVRTEMLLLYGKTHFYIGFRSVGYQSAFRPVLPGKERSFPSPLTWCSISDRTFA